MTLRVLKGGRDGPPLCGAKKRQGEGHCTQVAGWGTDHVGTGPCKLHGGNTATHRTAGQRQLATQACNRLGIAIEKDPGEALLGELWETVGNVAFYRDLVTDLPAHPGDDVYVPSDDERKGHWQRGEVGLYGRTYHLSGAPTGEAKPHILVQLYNAERKHLKDVAAEALKAGVEQRRVEIEQERATLVADVMRAIFDDPELGLDREQRHAGMRVAARHLRAVS